VDDSVKEVNESDDRQSLYSKTVLRVDKKVYTQERYQELTRQTEDLYSRTAPRVDRRLKAKKKEGN